MSASFRLGIDGFYRCDAFQSFFWQSHGFGTRQALSPEVVTLRQIHSGIVHNAHGLKDRDGEGDALISNEAGLGIGIRTADCVPILLIDAQQRAVAAIHAGWRGTLANIASATIDKMRSDFGSDPADLYAAIGPCIRQCCYEVGVDVAEKFAETPHPDGRLYVDLPGRNIGQLKAASVPDDRVFDSCLCTACQLDVFYSYRREPGEQGRLTSFITRI